MKLTLELQPGDLETLKHLIYQSGENPLKIARMINAVDTLDPKLEEDPLNKGINIYITIAGRKVKVFSPEGYSVAISIMLIIRAFVNFVNHHPFTIDDFELSFATVSATYFGSRIGEAVIRLVRSNKQELIASGIELDEQ